MSHRRRYHQRRDRQSRGHKDRKQESEKAVSIHGVTLSQGRNAGKCPGSQMRELDALMVNFPKRSTDDFLADENA
jgi:hypothetical protein